MRLNGYNKEDIELIRNAMYNKDIDDFVKKIELKYLGVHPDDLYERYYQIEICKQFSDLAEQIKVERMKVNVQKIIDMWNNKNYTSEERCKDFNAILKYYSRIINYADLGLLTININS